jgi:hypothetical protein
LIFKINFHTFENMVNIKKGRGGKRNGAGRKSGRTKEQLVVNISAGTTELLGRELAQNVAEKAIKMAVKKKLLK